jgi:hypothetical protein
MKLGWTSDLVWLYLSPIGLKQSVKGLGTQWPSFIPSHISRPHASRKGLADCYPVHIPPSLGRCCFLFEATTPSEELSYFGDCRARSENTLPLHVETGQSVLLSLLFWRLSTIISIPPLFLFASTKDEKSRLLHVRLVNSHPFTARPDLCIPRRTKSSAALIPRIIRLCALPCLFVSGLSGIHSESRIAGQ